jgi:hypothetical protein
VHDVLRVSFDFIPLGDWLESDTFLISGLDNNIQSQVKGISQSGVSCSSSLIPKVFTKEVTMSDYTAIVKDYTFKLKTMYAVRTSLQ